jgi:hypothetical protein
MYSHVDQGTTPLLRQRQNTFNKRYLVFRTPSLIDFVLMTANVYRYQPKCGGRSPAA